MIDASIATRERDCRRAVDPTASAITNPTHADDYNYHDRNCASTNNMASVDR